VTQRAFCRLECATLPFCDRHVRIDRSRHLPSHNRGIPVPRHPHTLGGHFRRRRLQLKIHQSQAARILRVSTVTLSRWERDTVYPTWAFQPSIVEYLGYDPFIDPALGRPKGNETPFVAILSSDGSVPFGTALRKYRLELRKNQKQFARELGVDAKTLRDWEAGRHTPLPRNQQRIRRFV